MQIYIIPTYECSLNCNSCYAKKYVEIFPQYLSWKDFISIYENFKFKSNNFSFIGGEATEWKFINEAILFLKNKGKHITLFSNGINITNSMPDNIIINASNLFDNELSMIICKNISLYKKKNVKITLRFNLSDDFEKHFLDAIYFANEYADAVSVSVLYPVDKNNKVIGQIIYQLAKELSQIQVKMKVSRATPLCLFTKSQREYLENNCKLKGICSLPTDSIVINPDGKSIQPCVELSMIKSIDDLLFLSPRLLFKDEIKTKIDMVNEECVDCEMYKNRKCCGGCLSYK